MNKKKILLVFATATLLGGCAVNKSTQDQIPDLSRSPTSEPKYTVVVSSASAVKTSPQEVIYQAEVQNISIKPYITNFAFNECNFISEKGIEHKGNMMTETSLKKAVLPGESQTISVNGQLSIACEYQSDGNKHCPTDSKLIIKDCTAYITSDGKQASNGYGNTPIQVIFPKNLSKP